MITAWKWISSILIPAGSTSILKAQLRLFYLMLGANVFKGFLYLYDAISNHAGDGSGRALRLIVTSIILIGTLRMFPKYLKFGIHWAICGTILHVYYRIFNQNIGADVVSMQAILMAIISSFYGLNGRWGIFYSVLVCAAPILSNYIDFRWTGLNPLPTTLNDIYIGINFFVILMSHVYFRSVLFRTLNEKDLLNDELALNAESKTEFLSTMAHELRTPLNSIIGLAGLLVDEKDTKDTKEHLGALKFSADNLLSLINNVLDVNRLEAGKIELEAAPFDLSALVQSVSTAMSVQAKVKGLQFHLEIDPQLNPHGYESDSTRISQLLFNLVGNAIKFTESGSVTLSASVMDHRPDFDLVKFQVQDTGIGISSKQQKYVFEPFVQASKSTNRKFGGTGLGLAIVKQLIEMFGGSLNLESQINKGTVISFTLPLKRVEQQISVPLENSFTGEDHLQSLSILLAEDNVMNIYFMKQVFKRFNIKADIAENGDEALELAKRNIYDVILMDLQMPVMDGDEVAQHIRQLQDLKKSKVYIIALTASVTPEVRERIKLSGMNDILEKPFQLEELKSKLLAAKQRD